MLARCNPGQSEGESCKGCLRLSPHHVEGITTLDFGQMPMITTKENGKVVRCSYRITQEAK